jgi:hypothetical protein
MKIDFSFMEVVAKPSVSNFEGKALDDLTQAMYRSAIHTFGWPIAAVIFNKEYEPKPVTGGIEARFSDPGHRDYWTLKRSGEFYFLGELFENNRKSTHIFIDTRTNRIAEAFLRVGKLYSLLGVPADERVYLMIKHGNIRGKILGASNTSRIFPVERKSNVDEVKSEFSVSIQEMSDPAVLKQNVHRAIRDLAEMFNMFNPDKASFTDPIVDAFLLGRIV